MSLSLKAWMLARWGPGRGVPNLGHFYDTPTNALKTHRRDLVSFVRDIQIWGGADVWPLSPRESLFPASRIVQKHLNLANPDW
jgi:hypothetical protein